MGDEREMTRVRARAQELLRGGEAGSSLAMEAGTVGTPIAVRAPGGELHSWFVPVTVGERLAGYFRFLPDLTVMGYSSFQRREESVEGCPPAEWWVDGEVVRRRAAEKARPGESAGEPVLSYDRGPSRLAWVVRLTRAGGGVRTVFVAGRTVWE